VTKDFESRNELLPGTVVQLKSGGPRMTVQGIVAESKCVICKWFDGRQSRSEAFHENSLTLSFRVSGFWTFVLTIRDKARRVFRSLFDHQSDHDRRHRTTWRRRYS